MRREREREREREIQSKAKTDAFETVPVRKAAWERLVYFKTDGLKG